MRKTISYAMASICRFYHLRRKNRSVRAQRKYQPCPCNILIGIKALAQEAFYMREDGCFERNEQPPPAIVSQATASPFFASRSILGYQEGRARAEAGARDFRAFVNCSHQ